MTTALTGELRRELPIGNERYVLTISPEGFKLTLKGRRKGYEVDWTSLVNGDAALATALNASLTAPLIPKPPAAKPSRKPAAKSQRRGR
jgi:hypothetical protein